MMLATADTVSCFQTALCNPQYEDPSTCSISSAGATTYGTVMYEFDSTSNDVRVTLNYLDFPSGATAQLYDFSGSTSLIRNDYNTFTGLTGQGTYVTLLSQIYTQTFAVLFQGDLNSNYLTLVTGYVFTQCPGYTSFDVKKKLKLASTKNHLRARDSHNRIV